MAEQFEVLSVDGVSPFAHFTEMATPTKYACYRFYPLYRSLALLRGLTATLTARSDRSHRASIDYSLLLHRFLVYIDTTALSALLSSLVSSLLP